MPYVTHVNITYSGTAVRRNANPRNINLTIDGLTYTGSRSNYYVDIPANATFVTVTLSPVDDALVEGDETANFTITADDAYDVVPPTTTFYLRDNEGAHSVVSWNCNFLTSPNTLQAIFSQDVGSSLAIGDFEFSMPSGVATPSLAYDPPGNIATLTFAAGAVPEASTPSRSRRTRL